MDDENESSCGKKRRCEAQWKRNKIKRARVKGEEYVDYKKRTVPAVTTGPHCGCKSKCTEKLEENKDEIFVRLRSMETKNEQDVFLQSLISCQDVKQHRPRKKGEDARPPHENSFIYNVMLGESKMQVCLNAFKSLYGIKISRIRRLRSLLLVGKSPKDLRGKKTGTNAIPATTTLLIREHVESYPLKESKYAGKVIKYLDARLNIKIIYRMFVEKHPGLKCSYKFFAGFFRDNYNYRFGRPQIDCCCTCEELNLKLKSPHLSEASKRCAAAELMIHRRKAQKFYNKLKHEREPDVLEQEKHVLTIAFDYMQNLSLPAIPVQETFYLRQLTINLFCIHDVKKNVANLYLYHEGSARKGPNEVCSFVYDYLMSAPEHITEVHIFSDNCGGQNKNHSLNRLLLALTDTGRFKKIEQYFPVRGHSFLPCDRDFAIIKKTLRKHDRLYSIHQLTELIITSSLSHKFIVKIIETEDILNFKQWWQVYYKKTCVSEETRGRNIKKSEKQNFGISTYMHFTYGGLVKGTITARNFIDGLTTQTFKLSHAAQTNIVFPVTTPAYPAGKVSIKRDKLNDIRSLLSYIPEEYLEFYHNILSWTTEDADEEPPAGSDTDAEED